MTMKAITHEVGNVVVVRRKYMREFLRRAGIEGSAVDRSIFTRVGNVFVVVAADWLDFLKWVKSERATTAAEGNGCEGFCDDACEEFGGCDFHFGSQGECGAACISGKVILEI